jgi:CRP-like cAMP-binding protein
VVCSGVRHGSVAVETFVPARGPMMIETIEAGEVIGWSWLFPPYRWHFDARALTQVRATSFDGACLRGKCDSDPALGYTLMSRFAQVLIERLQWTRLRLLDLYGDGNRS